MKRLILVCLLVLTACAQIGWGGSAPTAGAADQNAPATANLSITSPAFAANAEIPAKYTCQGEDISPAVDWPVPPAGTKSLALILDDPDAPGGTWVHWMVYNLPADTKGLPEGASQGKSQAANLPSGAVQGKNSFRRVNYGGPCPPSGEHHYIFHLYALDTTIADPSLDKAGLLKAMEGHILAQGELIGLYKKK